MKVEILYFDGCPNHEGAIHLVNEALQLEGITAEVAAIPVEDDETARKTAFLGSPSIRVNGKDVEPAARTARDWGMTCRTYVANGNRTGLPPLEMVRDAIRDALNIAAHDANPGAISKEVNLQQDATPDPVVSRLPFLMTGSVLAGIGASLCCTLPIVFALTGFSILGAAAFFESLRPYFLGVAFCLMGLGFYYNYRPLHQSACSPGTACALPSNRRAARITLWVITALVLAIAAFPYYSGPVAEFLLAETHLD